MQRINIAAKKIKNHFTSTTARVRFSGVGGGYAGKSHRCDSQKLADQCHGIRSELPAAGAGSWTRCDFEGLELSISHSAARVLADRFVDILNRDGVTLELAWRDRATIQNESGNIETR